MAAKKAEEVKEIVGLVKVKVVRGTNLAVRDVSSSDPYVVLKLGNQVIVNYLTDQNSLANYIFNCLSSFSCCNSSIISFS